MIQTDRLIIRPYCAEDATAFAPYFLGNRDYLSDSFPKTVNSIFCKKDLEKLYLQKEKNWAKKSEFACGIFSKKEKNPIGYIAVKNIEWSIPKGEVAYYVFEKNAGRGYATEALMSFIEWCFSEKKFIRLYAKIIAGNESSIRVVEKCGFRYEGLLKKDYRMGNHELVDLKIFGLTV